MNRPVNILLVEDNPADVRLTEEALKEIGIECKLHVCDDGEQAMKFLHENKHPKSGLRPDVILLDLNMPKKHGHDVLAEIKDNQDLSKIPIVVLTVSQDDEDILKALNLKMNTYMCKPVSASKLGAFLEILDLWEE